MSRSELFITVASEALRQGGFSFNVVHPINKDVAGLVAWREIPECAVFVSMSGLELIENDLAGIESLAWSRAKNAMNAYDEARQHEASSVT